MIADIEKKQEASKKVKELVAAINDLVSHLPKNVKIKFTQDQSNFMRNCPLEVSITETVNF